MKRWVMFLAILTIAVFLAACGNAEETQDTQKQDDAPTEEGTSNEEDTTTSNDVETNNGEEAEETNATAEEEVLVSLKDTEGAVVGTAALTEGDSGVDIHLEGENLPPGTHGFHIHEVGKCEPPTFESAGAHYNPTNAKHGFDDPEGPHAGDLRNIEVAEDGTVTEDVTADMVTLEIDGENTLYTDQGTALVIHSQADDYVSQPSGNAGDRIACGVIGE